jgi:hypothetical protein
VLLGLRGRESMGLADEAGEAKQGETGCDGSLSGCNSVESAAHGAHISAKMAE